MKITIYKQLGGYCEKEFHAETFEEMVGGVLGDAEKKGSAAVHAGAGASAVSALARDGAREGAGDPAARTERLDGSIGLEPVSAAPMMRAVFRDPVVPHQEGLVKARHLIARTGLMGVRIRGARISEQDPNRIVNVGSARTSDVITLIRLIRDRVRREHGILLEPRAKVVGRSLEELPVRPEGQAPAGS